ncbi:MAG: EAL domain-containing protein [Actinomycetota bacterium]|nr:EAL domain-containing protein [Actinomycetota bacterium]
MLVLVGVAALLIAHGVAGRMRTDAHLRAAHGVDLLVTIGADLPDLTRSALTSGLSPAAARQLDGAVTGGQHDGLLATLVIWDRTGRIVYSSVAKSEGTRPPKEAELVAALAGHSVTRAHSRELDETSGKPTGVLDAFEPLSDGGGVYGAMEAGLPLQPIEATAARSQQRSLRFIIGGAALVWLLLLPLWVRLARSQANEWIPGRRRILRDCRRALDRHEIELVYQPQIEPASQRVHGVEALVRWRRKGKLVGPDQFLPAVESSALMARLTDRILDLALAQHGRWRRAGIVTRVSVNLSTTDLADNTLPQRIAAKLDLHGVMGQNLTVEVTETAILDDPEQARSVLTALDQMGIDIAVDDFGTGHASISRLHGLPVSEVKIDRSFVSDTQQRSRTYLSAMIAFGRQLGLRVVAEGVEDAETLGILTTLNCDLAQGYLISRPLEPAAMTHWLTTANAAAAPEPAWPQT